MSSNESVEIKELHEKMNMILRSLELIQRRKLEKSRRNSNQSNSRSNNNNFTLNSPTSGGTVVQSSVINNGIREVSEMNRPMVCKPDVYSGDSGENANLWISSIERFLRLTRVEEELQVSTAVSYLKNNSQLWWESYLNSNVLNESEVSFVDFKKNFLARYQPINAIQSSHAKLIRWKQTSGIDAFINGFLNLSSMVPYSVVSELGRIDYFIEGLKPHIRRFVIAGKPTSIQMAITLARENAETFNNSSWTTNTNSSLQRSKSIINRRTFSNATENLNLDNMESLEGDKEEPQCATVGERSTSDMQSQTVFLTQLNEEQKQLYKSGCCFYCRQKGHVKKNCPKRKADLNKISHLNF